MFIELLVGHARLHSGIEIAPPDVQDPVHLRYIDAHSAPQRDDCTLQARAAAKLDNWHLDDLGIEGKGVLFA